MNPTALIRRKRDGGTLTEAEIGELIAGYVSAPEPVPIAEGCVADYQMAALAMAVCLKGMTTEETAALTDAMLRSGQVMTWSDAGGAVVDKHSTGGIGDKVSLILAPLLACEGLRVPMISGRGLGPTGGTLDKLEAIAGFRTDLPLAEMQRLTDEVGCVITGATAEIAPADKRLYGLRDVTATVESIPLITASIMSKKLAEGLDALVLDVKFGSGAFMKTREHAQTLAKSLVATGQRMNVKTSALLTDMNQPLGRMAGNANEVQESIDTLRGEGPADLTELTLELGAEILCLTREDADRNEKLKSLEAQIDSGNAYEKFEQMVAAQGGSLSKLSPLAASQEIRANTNGHIHSINTQQLGEAIIELGGGRKVMTDKIDHHVGLEMLVRIGDEVEAGQPLVRMFAGDKGWDAAAAMIAEAIEVAEAACEPRKLIAQRVN